MSSEFDFTILEISKKIYRRLGLILILVLISVLIGLAYIIFNKVNSKDYLNFYIQLKNIKEERYPDQSPFSPKDLKSSEVLQKVIMKHDLKMDEKTLAESLTVNYDNPLSIGLLRKYNLRIKAKNISPAEIDILNSQMKSELNALALQSLKLIIDYEDIKITKDLASKILKTIPSEWEKIYNTTSRPFYSNIDLNFNEISNFKISSYTDIIQMNRIIYDMKNGIKLLKDQTYTRGYLSDSGKNSLDGLLNKIDGFGKLFQTTLLSLNFNDAKKNYGKESYKFEVENNVKEKNELLKQLDKSIKSIESVITSENSSIGNFVETGENRIRRKDDLDDEVSVLLDLSTLQNKLVEYFEERINLTKEQMSLKQSLDSASREMAVDNYYVQTIVEDFKKLYNEYVLINQFANKSFKKDLYISLVPPFKTGSEDKIKVIEILILCFITGFLISIVIVTFVPSRKKIR